MNSLNSGHNLQSKLFEESDSQLCARLNTLVYLRPEKGHLSTFQKLAEPLLEVIYARGLSDQKLTIRDLEHYYRLDGERLTPLTSPHPEFLRPEWSGLVKDASFSHFLRENQQQIKLEHQLLQQDLRIIAAACFLFRENGAFLTSDPLEGNLITLKSEQ